MTKSNLLTAKRFEIINIIEFVVITLNIDNKTFVIYILALAKLIIMLIFFFLLSPSFPNNK